MEIFRIFSGCFFFFFLVMMIISVNQLLFYKAQSIYGGNGTQRKCKNAEKCSQTLSQFPPVALTALQDGIMR